jgi:hypothetical protein
VSLRALELPHEPVSHLHELFLAADALEAGDLARCRTLHASGAQTKLQPWHAHIDRVLELVLAVDAAPDGRAAAIARWTELWRLYRAALGYTMQRPLVDLDRAALAWLARKCGGLRGAWIRLLARL